MQTFSPVVCHRQILGFDYDAYNIFQLLSKTVQCCM